MNNFIRITLPTIMIMLVVIELILRMMPVDDPYKWFKQDRMSQINCRYIPSQFSPNQKCQFESNEGLPGVDSVITFSTNNYGFRGNNIKDKKDNCYRIFLVGGSTTECLYIDDKNSPNNKMQNLLKDIHAEVYNAGKSGDTSVDHIAMLSHRLVHLKPDLIILLCGLNDLHRGGRYDYTHRWQGGYDGNNANSLLFDLKLFLTDFQIPRRVYYTVRPNSIETIRFESNYLEAISHLKKLPTNSKEPEANIVAYETNLRSFAGICKQNNIKLILVTQASTWNSKEDSSINNLHWMSFIGEYRYQEEMMEKLLEKYNNIMKKVAFDSNVELYDLSKRVPRTKEYFYDDCHFNNNGADFYASELSDFIRTNHKINKSF